MMHNRISQCVVGIRIKNVTGGRIDSFNYYKHNYIIHIHRFLTSLLDVKNRVKRLQVNQIRILLYVKL